MYGILALPQHKPRCAKNIVPNQNLKQRNKSIYFLTYNTIVFCIQNISFMWKVSINCHYRNLQVLKILPQLITNIKFSLWKYIWCGHQMGHGQNGRQSISWYIESCGIVGIIIQGICTQQACNEGFWTRLMWNIRVRKTVVPERVKSFNLKNSKFVCILGSCNVLPCISVCHLF